MSSLHSSIPSQQLTLQVALPPVKQHTSPAAQSSGPSQYNATAPPVGQGPAGPPPAPPLPAVAEAQVPFVIPMSPPFVTQHTSPAEQGGVWPQTGGHRIAPGTSGTHDGVSEVARKQIAPARQSEVA